MLFKVIHKSTKRVVMQTEYSECIDLHACKVQDLHGYVFELDGKRASYRQLEEYLTHKQPVQANSNPTVNTSTTSARGKRVLCLNNNTVYKNMSAAGKALNLDSALISYSIKVNRPTKGYSFQLVE